MAKPGGVPAAPLLLAFVCVGASGLSAIAGDTLFLSAFSLGELSRFVGVSALVRVVASLVYAALFERWASRDPSPRHAAKFDASVIALAAGGFVVTSWGATLGGPIATYAVCLAQLVLPPILPLIAFNAIASALQARDAKRVLPLVAAAATAGSVTTSAIASLVAKRIGIAPLLLLSAAMAAAAIPILRRVAGASQEKEAPRSLVAEPVAAATSSFRDVVAIPAARVVLGFAFFGAIATSFVDYAFKAALKSSYDQAGVASALGVFGVVSNSVVLFLQLAVTGPLVARLGVGRTLAAFPALLGLASLTAFGLPPVAGTGIARLSETVVRYGVGNSIADVLLVPLARAVRVRVKVIVKGAASPLGALAASGALAAFGEDGPPRTVQLALVAIACVLLLASVRRAPSAYATALSSALARGRGFDVSPEAALVFRSTVRKELADAVGAKRFGDVQRTLELMTDRWFTIDDVRSALAAPDVETRRAGVAAAAKLGKGEPSAVALLAAVAPDEDPTIERTVLVEAREEGAVAPDARIERAIRLAEGHADSDAWSELWAEALVHDALHGIRDRDRGSSSGQGRLDLALKRLRKATREADSTRRAAALSAIGEVGDRRAERDVQAALSSSDPRVFRAAAETAVRLEASGIVGALVARLVAGPHPAVSAHALALAGPRAVRELIVALPVTRGEGAIAPTAVAEGRTVSGTVRAARALARIGQSASREVLPLFGDLGHRARIAVARAFSAHGLSAGGLSAGTDERRLVEEAIDKLVVYGQLLLSYRRALAAGEMRASRPGSEDRTLLDWELARRIEDTTTALFDLATALGDPRALQRARLFVLTNGAARDNALELLETVLSAPLGAKAARFATQATSDAPADDDGGAPPALDGWLEKCRKYDAGELPSSDPMASVLDRVLVLRDVPLFRALSGEDLYPVAEIATIEAFEPNVDVVRQGEPSDDLYVVVEGELTVLKDGVGVSALGPAQSFGELGVLDGEPRAATVRSIGACRLLRIPRSELEALLDESPELAKGIIRTLLAYVRAGAGPASLGRTDNATNR
ncbi:MAG: cyclic nucleotide-binding domain-containing protein [Polyangiaceae bacterium]|nr:cyclic nucleotide-binding domain-containing protein [Polyangiaceae bacterium]